MTLDAVLPLTGALLVGGLVVAQVAGCSQSRAPVLGAFVAHVLMGFVAYAIVGLYLPDAQSYHEGAKAYVDFWAGRSIEPPTEWGPTKEGWVRLLGVAYFILGAHPLLGIVINAVAAAIACSLVMGVTARLGWPDQARLAGWLTLLPIFVIWSSMLLRESIAWMLTMLAVWGACGLARVRPQVVDALALVAGAGGLLWIRGSLVGVLLAACLAGILVARRGPSVALLAGVASFWIVGPERLVRLLGSVDVNQINASRRELSAAGSGFETVGYSSVADIATSVPSTSLRTLLGPYPWELSALPPTAVVDLAAWIAILGCAALGWFRLGNRSKWVIAAVVVALLITIGATAGNYGTMIRIRATPAIVLLPLAAIGLAGAGQRRLPHERVAPEGGRLAKPASSPPFRRIVSTIGDGVTARRCGSEDKDFRCVC